MPISPCRTLRKGLLLLLLLLFFVVLVFASFTNSAKDENRISLPPASPGPPNSNPGPSSNNPEPSNSSLEPINGSPEPPNNSNHPPALSTGKTAYVSAYASLQPLPRESRPSASLPEEKRRRRNAIRRPATPSTTQSAWGFLRARQAWNRFQVLQTTDRQKSGGPEKEKRDEKAIRNSGTVLRWSPQGRAIMTAVEKLEKMSRLLIQLSKKMSAKSAKGFRALKSNFKKIAQSLVGQSRNDSGQVAPANSSLDVQSGKYAGVKRSTRGSSFLCPSEFVGGGSWSSCYKVSAVRGTWLEARSYCTSLGADLLSMETLKEAYIVDYLVKSYGTNSQQGSDQANAIQTRGAPLQLQNHHHHQQNHHQHHQAYRHPFPPPPPPPSRSPEFQYWTSATFGKDGVWRWTAGSRLTPVVYSRWLPGKPDAGFSRHCMVIGGKAGSTWNNVNCYEDHRFICEAAWSE